MNIIQMLPLKLEDTRSLPTVPAAAGGRCSGDGDDPEFALKAKNDDPYHLAGSPDGN
jgi:hypothetical protein